MAQIQVGELTYEAILTRQKDNLSVTFETDRSLEDLETEFSPECAPEIRVLKKDGPTQAIYKNHAVSGMIVRKDNGSRRVTVTMRIEQLTQTESENLRELITSQEKRAEEQNAILSELSVSVGEAMEAMREVAESALQAKTSARNAQSAADQASATAAELSEILAAIQEGVANAE